ncbi:MAG: hypothetical protein R3200_04365 [Xanthomonadales bacterium]|nr:hypothetical protein [Xanthomonadales bacterium]
MTKIITGIAASFAVLAGLVFLVTVGIGSPVSTDLSAIGKGKPALVLAYENYSPAGGEALNRMGQVKGDYESRIEFLVADLGVPAGQAFADRHRLDNGQAMFLTPDGRPLRAMSIPAEEQALRTLLDSLLSDLE